MALLSSRIALTFSAAFSSAVKRWLRKGSAYSKDDEILSITVLVSV